MQRKNWCHARVCCQSFKFQHDAWVKRAKIKYLFPSNRATIPSGFLSLSLAIPDPYTIRAVAWQSHCSWGQDPYPSETMCMAIPTNLRFELGEWGKAKQLRKHSWEQACSAGRHIGWLVWNSSKKSISDGFFSIICLVFFFFPFFGVKAHYSLYNKVRRSGQDLQFQTLNSALLFFITACVWMGVSLFSKYW